METTSSSDVVVDHIVALLCDIQCLHSEVFTPRALRLTLSKVKKRFAREGISLATKTLPRLGKALDRALTGEVPLNSVGWQKLPGSQLPIFMGELFQRIFSHDGWILPTPCGDCIERLRDILYCFYKYELPYSEKQEQSVLEAFKRTEDDLIKHCSVCASNSTCVATSAGCEYGFCWKTSGTTSVQYERVVAKARSALEELLLNFDERSIVPRHGPGAVSTKEKGPGKYKWTTIPTRITEVYPLDEYFYASLTAVCDKYREFNSLSHAELPAKVVLVPKDSRGPRLISEESLPMQYIQQGIMRALVSHVESHPLTRYNIHFTDQRPNQLGALLGSQRTLCSEMYHVSKGIPLRRLMVGKYATLDLKEASDRISLGLVHLLFPKRLVKALMASRSLSTKLPNGEEIQLRKFAPMGSALCFPVLALSIWAILNAGMPDADAREGILVYGDDVIVKTAEAENAMLLLESFGLKINRDKSCTRGFFRESCGLDAYAGKEVTPVRIRTVWRSSRCPDVLSAYCEYANSYDKKGYKNVRNLIAGRLTKLYGYIPTYGGPLGCPKFTFEPPESIEPLVRAQLDYQIRQVRVWGVRSVSIDKEVDGWMMLLRYFTEGATYGKPSKDQLSDLERLDKPRRDESYLLADAPNWLADISRPAFGVRKYTMRRTSKLVRQWITVPDGMINSFGANFAVSSIRGAKRRRRDRKSVV